MFKEVQLFEIEGNGFLHSYINEFLYGIDNKLIIKLCHMQI